MRPTTITAAAAARAAACAVAFAGVLVGAILGACAPLGPPNGEAPRTQAEPLEGFGSRTAGGAGGRVITIKEATEESVRAAFADAASTGHAVIRFEVETPITITQALPPLTAPNVTIEGRGATLDGRDLRRGPAIVEIRTNDVIVRDLRLRNGYDNLRLQGPAAFNVVVTHVSSTGAVDDGIAVGYGAHDVTVQYAFLAGNTRSFFCKYGGTTNVSLHHTWMQKAWSRSPLIAGSVRADVRNVIVEAWTEWGSRFEDGASGNVIGSLFVLSPYARSLGGKPDAALRFLRAGPIFTADNAFRGEAERGESGDAADALPAPTVRTLGVNEMERVVRARAGCLPRDRVDQAYIALVDGWRVGAGEALRVQR